MDLQRVVEHAKCPHVLLFDERPEHHASPEGVPGGERSSGGGPRGGDGAGWEVNSVLVVRREAEEVQQREEVVELVLDWRAGHSPPPLRFEREDGARA